MPYVMEVTNPDPDDDAVYYYTDHGRKPSTDLQDPKLLVLDVPTPRDPGDDTMFPKVNPVDAVGVEAAWVEITVDADGQRVRA